MARLKEKAVEVIKIPTKSETMRLAMILVVVNTLAQTWVFGLRKTGNLAELAIYASTMIAAVTLPKAIQKFAEKGGDR